MKYYLTYFMFFTILNLFAQDPQLFDYQWRLEKIVTAEETFIPSPEPDPNTGTFDYIWFYDLTSSGFDYYYFEFGVSANISAVDLIFSEDQNFVISDITVTLGESSPASIFMQIIGSIPKSV